MSNQNEFLCSASILALHVLQMFGFLFSWLLFLYIYFSSYSWILLPYLYWIVVLDFDGGNHGPRTLKCLKNSRITKYLQQYYPTNFVKSEEHQLDSKKNYLFVCAPHGVLGISLYFVFGPIFDTLKKHYPYHETQSTGLSYFFKVPFYRELILALGAGSSTAEFLVNMLTKPKGGQIVGLMPGGAEEAYHASPGTYKTIIKRRKGFVKIALKTGAPLVPVVCFGITNEFDYQVRHPLLTRFQNVWKKITHVAPIVARGRFYIPFFPKRVPITFVAGNPIEVSKVDNPTKEQVNELHCEFVQKLEEVFEKNKHHFVQNPEESFLEFV